MDRKWSHRGKKPAIVTNSALIPNRDMSGSVLNELIHLRTPEPSCADHIVRPSSDRTDMIVNTRHDKWISSAFPYLSWGPFPMKSGKQQRLDSPSPVLLSLSHHETAADTMLWIWGGIGRVDRSDEEFGRRVNVNGQTK